MPGFWLFKTEPDAFSIEDLANCPEARDGWDGIRNYQARNFMRDDARVGDQVFIYHSSCKNIGIAGLAEVSQVGLVDPTQFDPDSKYYDPKSTQENPRWVMVEVKHLETFKNVLQTQHIKSMAEITQLPLVKKGHRLSIMPVESSEFDALLQAARTN